MNVPVNSRSINIPTEFQSCFDKQRAAYLAAPEPSYAQRIADLKALNEFRPAAGYVSHPQGREADGPTGAGTDQVRADHQPQDRKGAWLRSARQRARARRRGHRMSAPGKLLRSCR